MGATLNRFATVSRGDSTGIMELEAASSIEDENARERHVREILAARVDEVLKTRARIRLECKSAYPGPALELAGADSIPGHGPGRRRNQVLGKPRKG